MNYSADMEEYAEHLNKITNDINRLLNDKLPSGNYANTVIDTQEIIRKAFDDDPKISYDINITGKDPSSMLVDIKPKNLYTSCMFLGLCPDPECSEEGSMEFERITVIYDHTEGMQVIPKDPLDNLDDIIPIF